MTQERKHPLDNRVPPPLVVLLVSVAMAGIAWFTPSIEIGKTVQFIGGSIAIAVGVLIVARGARTFWRHHTTINPVDIEQASALVTDGIFRYSRNPMYVGFTIVLIGWVVCLAAPWALIGPLGFVFFINRFQIIPEERMMHAKFGDAYNGYRARVRRWV